MRKMRLLAVVALFVAGLYSTALAANVAGWGKTTWGMSSDEVKKMFSDRIWKVRDDGVIELNALNLNGTFLGVRLIFDKQKQLKKVVLYKDPIAGEHKLDYLRNYQTLKEMLVQKYGTPSLENNGSTPGATVDKKAEWYLGPTQITLTTFDELTSIIYAPAKKLNEL